MVLGPNTSEFSKFMTRAIANGATALASWIREVKLFGGYVAAVRITKMTEIRKYAGKMRFWSVVNCAKGRARKHMPVLIKL